MGGSSYSGAAIDGRPLRHRLSLNPIATPPKSPMQQDVSLDHADAMRAVTAICSALLQQQQAAVIAVADAHGEPVALLRVGDVGLPSLDIATNKAFTAARARDATGNIGQASRKPEGGFDSSYFGDPRFIGWSGGLPVRLEGRVVGAVAVSGLTGEQDVALAQLGIDAILAAV
jgi:glc operon protein GlcG